MPLVRPFGDIFNKKMPAIVVVRDRSQIMSAGRRCNRDSQGIVEKFIGLSADFDLRRRSASKLEATDVNARLVPT